jgi:hypothetical protein
MWIASIKTFLFVFFWPSKSKQQAPRFTGRKGMPKVERSGRIGTFQLMLFWSLAELVTSGLWAIELL